MFEVLECWGVLEDPWKLVQNLKDVQVALKKFIKTHKHKEVVVEMAETLDLIE